MATLQAASSSSSSSSSASFRKIKATLNAQNLQSSNHFSLSRVLVDELNQRNELQTFKSASTQIEIMKPEIENNTKAMQKLYEIMEIVADRVELHKNIGSQ
jgi:uncharacterized membrane-anchored protein YhcB (DUF1043 family)